MKAAVPQQASQQSRGQSCDLTKWCRWWFVRGFFLKNNYVARGDANVDDVVGASRAIEAAVGFAQCCRALHELFRIIVFGGGDWTG